MFAQCPDCRKTYPVTKKHKRGKKTQIYCSDCKKKFNVSVLLLNENSTVLVTEAKTEYIPKPEALQKASAKKKSGNQWYSTIIGGFLKKNSANIAAVNSANDDPVPERLPWEVQKKSADTLWFLGFIAGLALLFGQIIYFEAGKVSQNPSYRPDLEKLCRWLGCQLAGYENIAEFAVLQSSFVPNSDGSMSFKAVINNQAAFKQRLPSIKLTLLDYNEQALAQRILSPKEYLPSGKRPNNTISPDETVEASFTIAAPKTRIGGYNFDLIY